MIPTSARSQVRGFDTPGPERSEGPDLFVKTHPGLRCAQDPACRWEFGSDAPGSYRVMHLDASGPHSYSPADNQSGRFESQLAARGRRSTETAKARQNLLPRAMPILGMVFSFVGSGGRCPGLRKKALP